MAKEFEFSLLGGILGGIFGFVFGILLDNTGVFPIPNLPEICVFLFALIGAFKDKISSIL